MKFVPIFANHLFAIHYEKEKLNEMDRLMDLWTDVEYLRKYAIANQEQNVKEFVQHIVENAQTIQDILARIEKGIDPLETFFRPLNDNETDIKVLSLQKGKIKKSELRLYAIKIDTNLFVITGGVIKFNTVWKMKDSTATYNEKIKLETAREYLKGNGVFDEDSFYELLNENEND